MSLFVGFLSDYNRRFEFILGIEDSKSANFMKSAFSRVSKLELTRYDRVSFSYSHPAYRSPYILA